MWVDLEERPKHTGSAPDSPHTHPLQALLLGTVPSLHLTAWSGKDQHEKSSVLEKLGRGPQ